MEYLDSIKQFCESTKGTFEQMGKALYYISHPVELGKIAWNGFVGVSFYITLIACLIAVIVYLGGYEKAKKYAWGSLYVYIVVKMLSAGA